VAKPKLFVIAPHMRIVSVTMNRFAEPINERGYWWTAAQPENRVVGSLSYTPHDGATLELFGSFVPLERLPQMPERMSILGVTETGKEVSLFQTIQTNARIRMPGVISTTLEAYKGCIGKQYSDEADILVRHIECDMTYLTEWAGQSGIRQEFDPPPSRTTRFIVEPPAKIVLGQLNGVEVAIVPYIQQHRSQDGVELKEYCRLQLKPNEPARFLDCEPLIVTVQKLLTLAIGEPCDPVKIDGKIPEQLFEIHGRPIWKDITLIRKFRKHETVKSLQPEQMLFRLQDLLPRPEEVLHRFREVESSLAPVFELFFPTYFFPDMTPPQEFLNLAHGLEAFHRGVHGGKYQTDDEYRDGLQQTLLRAIPADVTNEFRQSLEVKMRYLNEYSFRKRLKDILKEIEDIVAPYIRDIASFVDRVADARNRLVHASAETPPPSYPDLWNLAQQLGLVLEVVILGQIGFTRDRIPAIVQRGRRAELIRNNAIQ
jgi:ApeA N-terminal domain 1